MLSPTGRRQVILCGAALFRAASLPGLGWGPFVVIAIILRIAAWKKGVTRREDYLGGVLFWTLALLYLVQIHFLILPIAVSIAAFFWLIEGELFRLTSRLVSTPLAGALAIGSVDYLMSIIPMGGMPLAPLSQGLTDTGLLFLGGIIGEHGVSLLVIIIGASIFVIITSKKWHFMVLMLFPFAVAIDAKATYDFNKTIRVAAIQPLSMLSNSEQMLKHLKLLTDEALASNNPPKIIIWPESAWPYAAVMNNVKGKVSLPHKNETLTEDIEFYAEKQRLLMVDVLWNANEDTYLLTGANVRSPITQLESGEFLTARSNDALLFDVKGGILDRVSKKKLIPLAETFPIPSGVPGVKSIFNIIHDLTEYKPDWIQSKSLGPIKPIGAMPGLAVGICWENLFPDVFRNQIDDGDVEAIIIISNEEDFLDTREVSQMLAATRWRAVETGRSILRVSKSGYTALVSKNGDIIDNLPLNQAGVLIVDLPLVSPETRTVYGRWGWLIGPLFASLALLIAFMGWFQRWNRKL